MCKKSVLITMFLVCVLSMSAFAAESTVAESKWSNFMQTADLQYPAHNGQLTTDYSMRILLFHKFAPEKEGSILNWSFKSSGVYSLSNNIELSGSYANSELTSTNFKVQGGNLGLKAKCYQNKIFTLAVGGTATFNSINHLGDIENTLQGCINVYTNTNLGKFVKLYNNFSYTQRTDSNVVYGQKSITNVIEFDIDKRNIVRLLHTGNYIHIDRMSHNYSLIYRGQYSDKLTYIFSMQPEYDLNQPPQKYSLINNLIEYKPGKNLVLTGQYKKSIPKLNADAIQLDASQQIKNLKLSCGFTHSFSLTIGDVHILPYNVLAGTVKYNFTKHWALSLGGTYNTYYLDNSLFQRTLSLRTSLVWE